MPNNKTFGDSVKEVSDAFSTLLPSTKSVMGSISYICDSLTELKEINSTLTKINSNLSASHIEGIYEAASKYGKAVSDYLSDIQKMAAAGYANADEMAELSAALQAAGRMSSDLANSYIVAIDNAYRMNGSVEALTKTLDGANSIANNNSISMSELAEGMSAVGSHAASSRVSVEETTAAIAALIASTKQGGSETADAFKTILMNLRQVTGEVNGTEINTESLKRYEKACKALGVSLTEVKNGVVSLKEPMQILKELSVAYQGLGESDSRRINLLSATGGEAEAAALNALLEQYDLYEKLLRDYSDGTGSLAGDAEKMADSWEGSFNRLKNTWLDTIDNVANSDGITTLINGLNGLLSVINNITDAAGPLTSIGLGAGLFAGVRNTGKCV